jgi:hypothetical protein
MGALKLLDSSRLANIIVGWKGLQGINAIAYLENMAECLKTTVLARCPCNKIFRNHGSNVFYTGWSLPE